MKPYKSFKEYDSKVFQKARDKGILDSPKQKQKQIPEWFTKIESPDYIQNLLNNVVKNKIQGHNDRLVIWNNDFYSSTKLIHFQMIEHFVVKYNFDPNVKDKEKFIFDWSDYPKQFLGLVLYKGELYFSESYTKNQLNDLVKIVEVNTNHYLDIIHKIEKLSNSKFNYKIFK